MRAFLCRREIWTSLFSWLSKMSSAFPVEELSLREASKKAIAHISHQIPDSDPFTGVIKVGEEIEIVGYKEKQKTTVTGVEMFKKSLGQGEAGDNVGLLLRGLKRSEVYRGHHLNGSHLMCNHP